MWQKTWGNTRLPSPLEELKTLAYQYCLRYIHTDTFLLGCIHISNRYECPPLKDTHCILFVVQPENAFLVYFPKVVDSLPLPDDIVDTTSSTPTKYLFFLFS